MNFLTAKSLSRRTVLRGIGATIALPFLDAMVPSARAAGKPVNRFMAFYVPNGMAMEYWTPKGEGANFELSPILQPMAPYRNQMLVLSGLRASWNYIHAGASGSFLTGTPRGGKTEIEIIADVSIDQLLARHFSNETQVGSLELSMDAPANAGACTGILSCAYTHTLSWRSATQPLPMEYNPRAVFERLFGDTGRTDWTTREARMKQHKSILDSVTEKLTALKRELGAQDQSKVNEYTDAVRDVERRIQRAEEQSARPYPQIGVPEAHHPLSHHDNVPDLIAHMSKINRYHVELFSKYLAKLRGTTDGDGSLLDHMMILYGSGISNSQQHAGVNLPLMLVGGGAGTLKGGRHLLYKDRPSNANLLVSLMDKMGVPVEKVGGSNGKLNIDTLPEI